MKKSHQIGVGIKHQKLIESFRWLSRSALLLSSAIGLCFVAMGCLVLPIAIAASSNSNVDAEFSKSHDGPSGN